MMLGDENNSNNDNVKIKLKRQVNNIEEPAAAEHQHNLAKISTSVKSDNKKVEDVKSMIVNTELGVVDIGKEVEGHQLISSKSTPTPTSTTITNSSGINESMTTQQKEHQLSHLANQALNNSIQLAKHVPRNRNKVNYKSSMPLLGTTISLLMSKLIITSASATTVTIVLHKTQ
nr:14246_t:CDS:2 [Entrophospora candida]